MAARKKTTTKQGKLPFPKSKPKSRTITPSRSIVRAVTTKKPTTGTAVATTKPQSKTVVGKIGKVTASERGQRAAKEATTKKPNTGSSVEKTNSKTKKSRPSAQRVSNFTADQKRSTMNTSSNMSKFDSLLKRVRAFANNGDSGKAQKVVKSAINSDLKKADATVTRAARAAGLTQIPKNVATTLFQGLTRKGIIGLASSAVLIGTAIYANSGDEEKIVKKAKSLKKMPEAKEVKEVKATPLKNKPDPKPEKKTEIADSAGSKKQDDKTPKRKPLEQGRRKIGDIIVDSTDKGMSKFMGTKEEIAEQEMDEEMNFRKGGTPSKRVYGARAGGFTKRGGMYKKGY